MIYGVKWYWWLLLAVFFVLAIILWRKAIISSRERRERLKKEAEIWKRDYELRQKFSTITEKTFAETNDGELLHGVAMNIQIALEAAVDMNAAFDELEDEAKIVYSLEYFNEDAQKSLSEFFRNNGAPLVPIVPDALNAIGETAYIHLVNELLPMFDEDSEVSVDKAVIERCDEEFKELFNPDAMLKKAAAFIKENKGVFINA